VRLLGSSLEEIVDRFGQAELGLHGLLANRAPPSLAHGLHHRPVDVIQQLPVSGSQRDLQLNPDPAIGRPIKPYRTAIGAQALHRFRCLLLLQLQGGIGNDFDELDSWSHGSPLTTRNLEQITAPLLSFHLDQKRIGRESENKNRMLIECMSHLLDEVSIELADPQARTSARTSEDGDFFLEPAAKTILFDLQIVTGLKVQPETLGGTEVSRKAKRGVGCDRTLAMNDLVDSTRRHADVGRQPILREAQRFQKLLEKDLTRMNRR
jgi:hypothetical protein